MNIALGESLIFVKVRPSTGFVIPIRCLSHSTAHLCKRLLDTLERNSKVTISQFHKKCVIVSPFCFQNLHLFTSSNQLFIYISKHSKVAGLLHDVGHGPFSHAWERIGGRHEEMSILLVKNILGDRVPKFFSAPERLPGIYLVQSLINGDASLLSNENKYLAEVISTPDYIILISNE